MIGELVGGRFEVERAAGSGAMALVFRARDISTETPVALKVLKETGADVLARFEREAAILSDVSHPAVVRYVAHGALDSGHPYLAMEWLDGEDLEARLEAGPLSDAQARALGRAIASALAELHGRDVIHRDVKPGNIFLRAGRVEDPVLLDFGMARGEQRFGLTGTGQIVGTPLYMAPEQASGSRDLDARADVFALGGVLYTCLTQRPPFLASTLVALLAKIVLDDPPPLSALRSDVSADLEALVMQMLAKEASDRPADAAEVARLLSGPGGAVQSARRTLSTRTEQRVVCVVLAADIDEADIALDDTLASQAGGYRLADGSRVMMFAGPESPADLAARGVRFALGLLRNASAVSVACGRAVVSDLAPMGRTIDEAATLLADAIGVVRIDDTTAGLIEGRFQVERDAIGVIATGELTQSEGDAVRTLLGKPTRFVGRNRELAALEGYYDETLEEHAAAAILVTAPAGMGKSRLGRELVRKLADHDTPPLAVIARAESVASNASFAMVASAITHAAAIAPDDGPAARRAKVARRFGRQRSEFLCAALGLSPGGPPSDVMRAALHNPSAMFQHIRDAWVGWLTDEAAEHPVVLVAEDLHWGDQPSVLLIAAALHALAEERFVVLALARPEVKERFPDLWRGAPHELRLDPLRRRTTERFVRDALGADADDELVERIIDRADGNPFFLEELIRSAATGDVSALPDGIVGVVQVRLDGIAPDSRLALRAASVYGERFNRDSLPPLVGARVDIDEALRELVANELIEPQPTVGPGEFAFRHALVRDASYALLTDDQRRLAHSLAAEHLEASGSGEPIVLAEHYAAGGVDDKAALWYQKAAENALARNDLTSAIDAAHRARERVSDRHRRAELLVIVADAQHWLSQLPAAKEAALEAAKDLPRGGMRWLQAVGLAITVSGQLGDNETVKSLLEAVVDVEPDDDTVEPFVSCLARAASQLIWAHRIDVARQAIGRVHAIASSRELAPHVRARMHYADAYDALYDGRVDVCIAELRGAAACCERAGMVRDSLQAEMLCHLFAGLGGVFDPTIDSLVDIETRAHQLEASYLENWARFEIALVQTLSGDRAAGTATLAATSDEVKRTPLFAGSSAVWLCAAAVADDDVAFVRRVLDESRDSDIPARYRAALEAFEAWTLARQGDLGRAAKRARHAIAQLDAVDGMRADLYGCGYTIAALALRDCGEPVGELLTARRARLHEIADQIRDEALSRGFLRNIWWNRRLLELADEHGAR